MARLVLRGDLERVAAGLVRRRVTKAARDLGDEVARRVPPAKVWVSMHDDRVRHYHQDADGQTIPDNVPYRLPKVVYVRGGDTKAGGWQKTPGWDLASEPRDPGLPIHQRINCRCKSKAVPGLTARMVRVRDARPEGARVSAQVSIRFTRIAESEYSSRGGGWARDSLRAVRARYARR